jgi:hypothetical protein
MKSQKRAIIRIMLELGPFKKTKCRKNNWFRVRVRKKETNRLLVNGGSEMIKKDSQKLWLWIKKKKSWTMDVIFDKRPDLKALMERLRLMRFTGPQDQSLGVLPAHA